MKDKAPFSLDLKAIRAHARRDIAQGAVTDEYKADRTAILHLLDSSLATELTSPAGEMR